jgi:uncharacterized oligopeptide transporter (OPT) family protein
VFGNGSRCSGAAVTLMATIIKGLPNQNPPWGCVLVGAFVSATPSFCGSVAVVRGRFYRPSQRRLSPSLAVCTCSVERKTGAAADSEVGAGTLFSSGLIAGGSLCGILYAVLVGTGKISLPETIGSMLPFLHSEGPSGYVASALLFIALAIILARAAQKKVM